jgi:hypothetical protein
MSLGDLATNALSGNPSAQMAQALAGPQPGAQGGGGQQGAMNPSPAPAMAQPQATQSPPDLAKLYMQLYNQQRGAAMFDQGVAGLQAATAPPGQQAAWLAHGNQGGRQDPGQMLQNLMQMQYMQRLNEARPAMVQALTGDGSGGGATGGLPAAVVNALPPDQLMKLLDQRAQSGLQIAQQGTEMKQKELIEAQEKAPSSLQQMSDMDSVANQLKGPLNPALTSLISSPSARIAAEKLLETDPAKEPWDSTKNLVYQNMLSSDQLAAVNQLKKLDAQIYGDAFQSTGSRRTQVEVANLKNGISTLMNFNQSPEAYMNQFNDFHKQLRKTMANTYGAAGRVDEIPDAIKWDMTDPKNPKPMVDTAYLPNGDKYGGKGGQWASQPPPPTQINTPADFSAAYSKLSSGATYTAPDGTQRRKQ